MDQGAGCRILEAVPAARSDRVIFVDRTAVPEPPSLKAKDEHGTTETDRAVTYYTVNWDGKQYEFKRYKSDDVKEALEQLFHGKCAYCESSYGHISPDDIEHWRPKGGVVLADGTKRKRGYYWLAATWSNLLPSCIHCNRKSRQEDARDPANEQSGKQNLFPVLDEAQRWTEYNQQNQNGESALLLNPCVDHPEEFINVNDIAIICEKHPPPGLENHRAKASIDVFGLNRRLLVNERLE